MVIKCLTVRFKCSIKEYPVIYQIYVWEEFQLKEKKTGSKKILAISVVFRTLHVYAYMYTGYILFWRIYKNYKPINRHRNPYELMALSLSLDLLVSSPLNIYTGNYWQEVFSWRRNLFFFTSLLAKNFCLSVFSYKIKIYMLCIIKVRETINVFERERCLQKKTVFPVGGKYWWWWMKYS